jgi:chaperonin GroES
MGEVLMTGKSGGKMAKALIQPMADWVAVKRAKPETKSSGGIDLPESAHKHRDDGVVYAIGPDVSGLEKGDEVTWQKRAGQEVVVEEEHFLMLKPGQIFFKKLK